MICLAFQRPNGLIAKHFEVNPCLTSKPIFKFNRIQFLHHSSELILPLKFRSPRSRRRGMSKKASDVPPTVMLTSGPSVRISALLSLTSLSSLWRLICSFFLILSLQFRGRRRFTAVGAAPESPEKSCRKDGRPLAIKGKPVRVPARKSAAEIEVAARRALAIKRVVEDNSNSKETVRDYSLLVTSRGDTIFTQSWTPVKVQVRGLIILLHGLNEHSGRYNDFAKKLNANGFKVYGMDWIGHGGSDGLHGYVPSLDYAVNDLKMFLSKVLSENPSLPCFCFGHSTGGAIILKAAVDPKVRQHIAGIVMSSPAIGVQPTHPIVLVLAPVLVFLLPRYQFSAANKKGILVSRDPEALAAKYSDPLVFTGSIRVRTGYEILRITTYLQQNLSKLTVPFFVLHGTADLVTDPEASQRLYNEASATDKTIKLCDRLLHDLLFEPEKEEIMESIVSWLAARL